MILSGIRIQLILYMDLKEASVNNSVQRVLDVLVLDGSQPVTHKL